VRFLADMGVSMRVVEWLRNNGHDVTHLREQGLQRLPNGGIFKKAVAEDRVIVTFDLDFGEIAALFPKPETSRGFACAARTRMPQNAPRLPSGRCAGRRAKSGRNVPSELPIRPKEPLAVEMNDVAGCLGDPNLRFPCDVREVLGHGPSREKRSYEH
jgi:hypothetical protein